jgi:TPR repeat protein
MTDSPLPSPPDLSLKSLGLSIAALLLLALIAAIFMPLPRLFASPGEDRSQIEPWHPQIRAVLDQAKSGNLQAMRALANLYLEGRETPQDIPRGISWLTKAANAGDLDAMNILGVMALNGRAGKPDPDTAAKWFRAAAEKSDPAGLLNLGMCYATGRGVTADRSVAIIYLTRAATTGNPTQRAQAQSLLKQLGAQ